ncbi:MAG: hypothetical protein KKB59_18840 [Spirochaetes bacterium]|nr:hypothetical protein [Spirochaetota bacterium]
MARLLSCSCCGAGIRDIEAENAHFGIEPYPDDYGFGMCLGCGGDKKAKSFKKLLGWGMCAFFEARFKVIRDALNDVNREKWDKCTYEKRCGMVKWSLEKGILKW